MRKLVVIEIRDPRSLDDNWSYEKTVDESEAEIRMQGLRREFGYECRATPKN